MTKISLKRAFFAMGTGGTLLVSDDGSNSVWRITYSGHPGSN